uniref:Uncharacterized protein n=1 Tax=Schistocephalus solidus TaxID=70667 RepID=A0A183TUR0_SCHSO
LLIPAYHRHLSRLHLIQSKPLLLRYPTSTGRTRTADPQFCPGDDASCRSWDSGEEVVSIGWGGDDSSGGGTLELAGGAVAKQGEMEEGAELGTGDISGLVIFLVCSL